MALKITKDTKVVQLPYTRKEIMEIFYPELWKQANEGVGKLKELQEKVVPFLPITWKQIPDPCKESSEVLRDKRIQLNLWEYLYFKSLYGFSEKLWKTIERQCRCLTEAQNTNDQEAIDKAKALIENTLSVVSTINPEEFVNDHATGMFRLTSLLKRFKGKPSDFTVLTDLSERCTWSFKDIIGSIENYGLGSSLWAFASTDYLPSDSNVGKLLDDNKMKRIY